MYIYRAFATASDDFARVRLGSAVLFALCLFANLIFKLRKIITIGSIKTWSLPV
jgi:hypothetical protein